MKELKEGLGKTPKITLVGAGPGDPELITLKGVKALQQADVVLYDALIGEELLTFIKPDATKVYVGKRSGDHAFSQAKVNQLMVDYALNFGHVVRLKGGDPFVFGRGYEEIAFAAGHGIKVSVIPGVSSSIGVPGLQHIPVTHRGMSESFWVVTGTTSTGELSQDLVDAASSNATVVVLMGLNKIREIVRVFIAIGKAQLPAAAIQSGSTEEERILVSDVAHLAEKVEKEGLRAPALLVFGDVVSLHPSFKSSPLSYVADLG